MNPITLDNIKDATMRDYRTFHISYNLPATQHVLSFSRIFQKSGVYMFHVYIDGQIIGECYKEWRDRDFWQADMQTLAPIFYDEEGPYSWVKAPLISHAVNPWTVFHGIYVFHLSLLVKEYWIATCRYDTL